MQCKTIDLDKKENIVKGKDMGIGFGAKGVISDLKSMELVTKEQVRTFQGWVYSFVSSMVNKIFDRSPWMLIVERNVNVFDPKRMLQERASSLQKKLKHILNYFIKLIRS